MRPNPLRNIPSISELLENPSLKAVLDRIHPGAVIATARSVLEEAAAELRSAAADRTMPSVSELAERISRRVFENASPGARPAINATGILLHPELGPPPLADEAIKAMVVAAGEYTLGSADATGCEFPPENALVESLLQELTGAEAAFVVANDAAATLLALSAIAGGRETIVARGQIVRRDDRYDLAQLASAAKTSLCEVGAVNHVEGDDYVRAVGDRTALLLRVHPGETAMVDGSDGVTLERLVALARENGLPLIDDLGAAALIDLAPHGLDSVPLVTRSLVAGADLVLFGHPWLGGPTCGVIAGRRRWVDEIRRHSMTGMFRPEQPMLAALAATLQLMRNPEQARRRVPMLQLATTSADNLKSRAERLAAQMTAAKSIQNASAITSAGFLRPGGRSVELPGWSVRAIPRGGDAARLADMLRAAEPSVIGQVDQDAVLLNFRTVLPRQDVTLVEVVESLSSEL